MKKQLKAPPILVHPNAWPPLPTAEQLPPQLFENPSWRNRFLCWALARRRDCDRVTKIPLRPTTAEWASSKASWTWGTFEKARAMAEMSRDCFGIFEAGPDSFLTGGWVHGLGIVLGARL